jgi:dTDP-4-dehydrorhamnose 3,5-epimerase
MDLLPETSQPFRADERSSLRIDGKGMRMQLDVHALSIPDVRLIRTPRFSDARGYFCETFQRADFAAQGLDYDFLQDNQSSSERPRTIRGLPCVGNRRSRFHRFGGLPSPCAGS